MCSMNCCCSIITVVMLLILALILTNAIDVYVSTKQHGKSQQQQLDEFRNEAKKAEKDIEVLAKFAEFNAEHGSRKKRQAEDLFDDFGDQMDKEQFEEQQIQQNCNPDICKARNCAGGICRAESPKQASKELNDFLNNLQVEGKSMPREILLDENQSNAVPNEAEEEGEKSLRGANSSSQKKAEETSRGRQKRLQLQSGQKNNLQFRWPQNAEKSKFRAVANTKQKPNLVKSNEAETDLSSCQQCSPNKLTDISNNNCKNHKSDSRPVVNYENIKISKQPERAEENEMVFNSFKRNKYHKKTKQTNAADVGNEPDDEDDELSHIDSMKLSNFHPKNQINPYEFKQPALKITKNPENVALNDQLEVSKNNLAHEADYKLSKDEQNAAENKRQPSWKWGGIFKRSHPFNAMNEIKLKTSQRLMKKGFGASLPSYSLAEIRRELYIDNKLKEREKEILQSNNNRKYKEFDDMHGFEHNYGRYKNRLEDLAEMPMEMEMPAPNLNTWTKARYKRISTTKSRQKRELNTFNDRNATKAFKYKKLANRQKSSILHKSFRGKSTEAKANGKLTHTHKAFKTKALTNKVNAIKRKEIEKLKTKRNNFRSRNKQNLAKTLSFRHNETKVLEDKNDSHGVNKLHFGKAFGTLVNTTQAVKTDNNFYNEKALKLQFANSKSAKAEESSASSFQLPDPTLVQPLKRLKRVKRFNPNQTIDLKIYQKHYNNKALKLKKQQKQQQRIPNQKNKGRYKRALSSIAYAKSCAGQQHLIVKGAKLLIKKAVQMRKNIESFFKKCLNCLTFSKQSSNKTTSFKALASASLTLNNKEVLKLKDNKLRLESDTNSSSLERKRILEKSNVKVEAAKCSESSTNLSSVGGKRKLEVNNVKVQATKYYFKTSNPKMRFLKDFLNQLSSPKQYLEDSRAANIPKLGSLRAKASLKERNTNNFRSKTTKAFFTKDYIIKKSSKEPLIYAGFFKNIANISKSGLPVKDEDTSSTKKSFFKLNTTLENNQSRLQKLLNASNINASLKILKKNKTRGNYENKVKEKVKRSLNVSFGNDELRGIIPGHDNSTQSLLDKTKAFETKNPARVLQNFNAKLKAFTTFKRFKRSLEENPESDHPKTEALNHIQKRSYLFHYDDLYKPNSKSASNMKLPSKLDINIEKSPKLLAHEKVLPTNQELDVENYYKILNKKKFDETKNFDFDNIWPESETENDHQQKRFLTTAEDKSSSTKPKSFRIPFKRNNAAKNHNSQLKLSSVQVLKDKYLKDLQNFNKNYKFSPNVKTNSNNNNNNTMEYSEKLGLELQNEILNCKAFASLEDFINSLPKNLTQPLLYGNCSNEKIANDFNTTAVTMTIQPLIVPTTDNYSPNTPKECSDKQTAVETTTTSESVTQSNCDENMEQTSESEPPQNEDSDETTLEPVEEQEDEDINTEMVTSSPVDDQKHIKVNISFNAQVQGNSKEPYYFGNGSFNVTPALLDDRLRRDLQLSPLEKIPTEFLRLTNQAAKHDEQEDLTDFISGKFSAKAVKDVLDVVQESPQLRALRPCLNLNQKFEVANQPNFYAIRNQHNEPQMRSTEKLFAQAMSAINAIIEQQARSRSCVPLRPDLQEFYNMIIQARQQPEMVREKRQLKKPSRKQDFSHQLHLLDSNKIEEKTKIVKKLLKDFEELPKEDQQQVAAVRDDLLKNLIILRQLQDNEERQEHEWRERRENDWAASDEAVLKSLQGQYSSQYLKLLKAAELYREIKSD